ncbi:MAG: hypothetical protein RL685_818 [Pseudomonadota bacterium]|jgi:hypothetical protein
MKMMHPTCTELGSWHPADRVSATARHLSACARCRGLQARLATERAELEHLLPSASFLASLEAVELACASDTPVTERGASNLPFPEAVAALCRDAVGRDAAALELDRESGLIWAKLPGGTLPLGDLRELQAYLEGAYLSAWSELGAPGPQAVLEQRMQREVGAALESLRPRLEALGWVEETRVAAASLSRRALRTVSAGGRGRAWLAASVAAPLALALLVLRGSSFRPDAEQEPASTVSSSRSGERPDLVAKGARGLPRVVLMVRRGETSLEYDDTATVMPGDRLRLRFRKDAPGQVLAGIQTDSGEWVPFFEAHFVAGEHTPQPTLRVDERPTAGQVLLGEPNAVRARLKGAPSPDVSVIRLAWAPAPEAGR